MTVSAQKVAVRRLAHLVLRVRELDRSERFYTQVLGLHVTGRVPDRMVFFAADDSSSHELATMALGPDAPGPEQHRVGLYHFAWQMASVEELEQLHRHLKAHNIPIVGIGDHGVSIGVYFLDPEKTDAPQLLPAQNPERINSNMAFSADGQKLAISSRLPRPKKKKAAKKQ